VLVTSNDDVESEVLLEMVLSASSVVLEERISLVEDDAYCVLDSKLAVDDSKLLLLLLLLDCASLVVASSVLDPSELKVDSNGVLEEVSVVSSVDQVVRSSLVVAEVVWNSVDEPVV
jgi:hypothetical protein